MQNDSDERWKPPGPMDFLMGMGNSSDDECEKCGHTKNRCKCRDKCNCHSSEHAVGCCDVIIEEDVCVEAKVTIKPTVDVGKIKIECIETNVEKVGKQNINLKEECTAFINQVIRVKIPLKFNTCVDAQKTGIICKPFIANENCDC